MHKRLSIFTIFFFFILAPLASAQTLPEPVQYIVTPEIPGPNQTVSIEAQGIGAFLGDATITWQKDGKVVQTGAGLRTYSFTTGGLGSITKIHIDIKSPTSGSFSKDLVFRPSAVSLVWEADTSAPPLYMGKPLYSAGSPLRIAAFPTVVINGARVAPQSLSYQWSRNGNTLPAQSGLGHSTLLLQGDQLQPEEDITVDVYFGSSLVGRGGVAIPASQPQVLLYERDALRGTLFDAALPESISLGAKEITLLAQPYFFDRASVASAGVQYDWTLNNNEITGPDSARGILTLRQTGSGEGSAALQVSLQNTNNDMLIQAAKATLNIVLGSQASNGSLFGI
ncbi:MAG TPA: hypothetical protein VGP13_00860 [Candidatus Paceibacterota bacterium]|jgi:hypothetical protein|nr:hypothetical protein [Candidatus Paceibacterota bacterium]